jgi:hypothetical protein
MDWRVSTLPFGLFWKLLGIGLLPRIADIFRLVVHPRDVPRWVDAVQAIMTPSKSTASTVMFTYELAPGCFIRAGEGPIEIGCCADQCEMRERLRKVSEMLAVRPKFL